MSNEKPTLYKSASGNQMRLTTDTVRKYLTSGYGRPTDQEVIMYLALCKHQRLDPFLRECYLIKYGDKQPATIVVSQEAFLRRAFRNPRYKGHETGIKVWDEENKVAYCNVYVDGHQVPIYVEVDYDEYVGTKKNKDTGEQEVNSMWTSKPKTMLKKVARVHALREAFPEDVAGLYIGEEISHVDSSELPTETTDATVIDDTPSIAVKDPDNPISKAQIKLINARLTQYSVDRHHFKGEFGIDHIEELKRGQMESALEYIKNYKPEESNGS